MFQLDLAFRVITVLQAVQVPGEVLGTAQLAVYCPVEQRVQEAWVQVELYPPLKE